MAIVPIGVSAMCDQCEAMTINGVACHETGCPRSWCDAAIGEPIPAECDFCGSEYTPEDADQRFCSPCCAASYWGYPCDCGYCD